MTTSDRKIAIEKILFEHKDRFMRVPELRDLLMLSHDFQHEDKAQLRRWVNSYLVSMEDKGRVEKEREPESNKWVYRLVLDEDNCNDFRGDRNYAIEDLDEILSELENQLMEKQRSSQIYIGQLNTFKKMQENYPKLSKYAHKKYQSVFNESYDLLGQIKALEETLKDHGRSIRQCL